MSHSVVARSIMMSASQELAVLTPTTFKTIEQSILETLGEDPSAVQESCSLSPNGSFIPPLPTTITVVTNSWQGGEVSNSTVEEVEKKPLVENRVNSNTRSGGNRKVTGQKNNNSNPRRQMGGRKPGKNSSSGSKYQLPEDTEKRKIRRERNKLAAARCRKRRVDQTNSLLEETEGLESDKKDLQRQIEELQNIKNELECLLESHEPSCLRRRNNGTSLRLVSIDSLSKPIKIEPLTTSTQMNTLKPKRPTSLTMVTTASATNNNTRRIVNNIPTTTSKGSDSNLIPIQTPSAGLNFIDMDWNDLPPTGLTPTSGATPTNFNSITTPTPLVTPSTANILFAATLNNGNKKPSEEENVKMLQL